MNIIDKQEAQIIYEIMLKDDRFQCTCDESYREDKYFQAAGHYHHCMLYQVTRAIEVTQRILNGQTIKDGRFQLRGEQGFKEETRFYEKMGHVEDRKCGVCGGKAELGPFCGGPFVYYCKGCHDKFEVIMRVYKWHLEFTGFAIYRKRGFRKSQANKSNFCELLGHAQKCAICDFWANRCVHPDNSTNNSNSKVDQA